MGRIHRSGVLLPRPAATAHTGPLSPNYDRLPVRIGGTLVMCCPVRVMGQGVSHDGTCIEHTPSHVKGLFPIVPLSCCPVILFYVIPGPVPGIQGQIWTAGTALSDICHLPPRQDSVTCYSMDPRHKGEDDNKVTDHKYA